MGYEGGFGCPSWFFILFRCLLVHLLFLELGWFLVTCWWLLLRLLVLVSSAARSHIPDAFASSSTPISGSWMVLAPVFFFLCFALGPSFSLPVLAASSGYLRFFLSCPTSIAPLRWLLPWLFVGYLLAGHRGAAVPLASGVWCCA